MSTGAAASRLTVIGMGYIGLPTAVVFAQSGWTVTGVDVSQRVVDLVNQGKLPFVEAGLEEELAQVVANKTLHAQLSPSESDIFIVSVPTPFKGGHEADLSYIDSASKALAPQLRGDELIILESTSPPGTTEHMANHILQLRPDLSLDGRDNKPILHFAHAPERVLPGRIMIELRANDRVIGGITPEAGQRAKDVYATFCDGELSLTDARTAEMAKLTENAFRDVNIAFANELSLIASQLDIDVWELIELANKHPRVNVLQPGPGVGGHCIAVDPWFIVSSAPESSQLIRTARQVNDSKPAWVIEQIKNALSSADKNATVALLGLAFKPNIDDLRESPSLSITTRLLNEFPDTEFLLVEPNIGELPERLRSFPNATLLGPIEAVTASSIVVVLVDHDEFKQMDKSLLSGKNVIDTKGIWRK